ncbi:metallophosphoesterase [Bradyrhizobium sp. CB82]|uniref:metallophosphoesterase family protein n=1 Tax=Bradyrhizobium sp. CB82 TaxID=3039159 RepID=UPI0024B1FC0E|nr:metallophosphoesterase [Bradyrhizobium sp. CB82]WFU44146.1 metallophosphoesterase [Bradyrhizobium sp. CB82]
MPKIAHISDIHFGKTFDVDVWRNVRRRIQEFNPDLLIVSGDVVDHPRPFQMMAVKAELLDVCASCSSEPELFIVPGNHDVRLWGNLRLRVWPRWLERILLPEWFERIMFSDINEAKEKIEAELGISLGLNENCKKLTWRRRLKGLKPGNWIRRYVKASTCDGRVQSCDRCRNGGIWPTESLHRRITIVCFDSNPAKGRGRAFASGEVGQSQITRLDHGLRAEQSQACPKTCKAKNTDAVLLRIAVLHHHPLPIAVSAASFRTIAREAKLEPYLVLRNSGDLLQQLQNHKFDLVLHGHKHRPQFARLELNTDGADPYPLTVLAAGSTAKADEDKANNTLRLLETEPNGRLAVRTIERGEIWSDDEEPYREELPKLKQRAFSRARELTKRTAGLLRWETRIDAVGNVNMTTEVRKIRLLHGAEVVKGFPFLVTIPSHGQRFNDLIQLDRQYQDAMELMWRAEDNNLYALDDVPQGQRGYCWIQLKQPLEPGSSRAIDYRIHHAVTNSIAMNSWELAERARLDARLKGRDHESVRRYVAYPADRLLFRLVLPPSLADVHPELRCRRAPRYPEFPLTFLPDVAMETATADPRFRTFDHFEIDDDLQGEEQHKLRYIPQELAWELDIENPVPGYVYELRWKVPKGNIADVPVRDGTTVRQKILCDFRDRIREYSEAEKSGAGSPKLAEVDRECCNLFKDFAATLMQDLAGVDPSERQAVFLMVYDSSNLELHAVRSCLSWSIEPPQSFAVPLGGGIAGAAFLQNKVIAWGKAPDSKSLIRPKPLPGLDPQYVLALPIFYIGQNELVIKTGAVIGVVTVASDSVGSQIADCCGETAEAVKRRADLQLSAQAVVTTMLHRLSRQSVPNSRPTP